MTASEVHPPLPVNTTPSGPPAPKRRRQVSDHRARVAWTMVAPAGLHALFWIALPVLATFALSVTNYSVLAPLRFVGLGNYITAFRDPIFLTSIWHTAVYTFFTVPVAMAIAVFLAVLLNQQIRARAWYRAAVFLPQVTATVAVATVWYQIYDPYSGLANKLLSFLGITGPAWLADPSYALSAVIVMGVWQGIGIKMIIYLAALQNLPDELFEAAELDGANAWQRFRRITLPMLRPATLFVGVVSIISAFQAFDQVYVLTRGGPANATTMMTYEVYKNAFATFQMGMACAKSVVLFVFLFGLTLLNRKLTGGDEDE
ncbi:MAG: multiple sugar transport system permease protein [Pseudonocardiales bacterium]|jgi:multiple sugar transport system permease protein|nr:multiple sugar transport system permease protein [Pseudonocardiales bacterium]